MSTQSRPSCPIWDVGQPRLQSAQETGLDSILSHITCTKLHTYTHQHMHIHAYSILVHACTHVHIHTHLNLAVIEEPAGETHDGRVTAVVDEQLRLVGRCTRQLAVQVVEAHEE